MIADNLTVLLGRRQADMLMGLANSFTGAIMNEKRSNSYWFNRMYRREWLIKSAPYLVFYLCMVLFLYHWSAGKAYFWQQPKFWAFICAAVLGIGKFLLAAIPQLRAVPDEALLLSTLPKPGHRLAWLLNQASYFAAYGLLYIALFTKVLEPS